jgi:Leucine-rich repeat (LRR) protein
MIKNDVEILKEILKKRNISIDEFKMYKSHDEIPKEFFKFISWYLVQDGKITALCIRDKNIQHIDLSYFQELQDLHLIRCDISELSLSYLPKLTKLKLSVNIDQVDLSGLRELQELILSECNIQEIKIPQELRGKIKIIGFDENKIEWV